MARLPIFIIWPQHFSLVPSPLYTSEFELTAFKWTLRETNAAQKDDLKSDWRSLCTYSTTSLLCKIITVSIRQRVKIELSGTRTKFSELRNYGRQDKLNVDWMKGAHLSNRKINITIIITIFNPGRFLFSSWESHPNNSVTWRNPKVRDSPTRASAKTFVNDWKWIRDFVFLFIILCTADVLPQ